jgi:WXG100 family type VII secretion target
MPARAQAPRHLKKGISTMGQAIVDPQELRRFAARLRHFSDEVMSQMQNVQRQLAALGSTWRDQEHKKFEEEFAQQLNTFGRFVQSTGEYVPYLIRKAERVEEYQQQS